MNENAQQMPLMALGWAVIYGILDPLLRRAYGVKVTSEWRHDPFNTHSMRKTCNDMFVTQYDGHDTNRTGLPEHRDAQDFACVIPLNDMSHILGGGTSYSNFADGDGNTPAVVRLGQGFISAHAACVLHKSVTTKKTLSKKNAQTCRESEQKAKGYPETDFRYILAGFVKVEPMGVDGAPEYLSLSEPKIAGASKKVANQSPGKREMAAHQAEMDVKLAQLHANECDK